MTRIDRAINTPFLLRVFPKHGRFHDVRDFDTDALPVPEHHLYAWADMTLGELTDLLMRDIFTDEEESLAGYRLSFKLVYGDNARGRLDTRNIGTVQVSSKSWDYNKSLDAARFVVGDFINVAIMKPGDRLYNTEQNKTNGGFEAQTKQNYRRPYDSKPAQDRRRRSRSWSRDRVGPYEGRHKRDGSRPNGYEDGRRSSFHRGRSDRR